MKMNYIIILAIMAVACYFLFIRRPKTRPAADIDAHDSDQGDDSSI